MALVLPLASCVPLSWRAFPRVDSRSLPAKLQALQFEVVWRMILRGSQMALVRFFPLTFGHPQRCRMRNTNVKRALRFGSWQPVDVRYFSSSLDLFHISNWERAFTEHLQWLTSSVPLQCCTEKNNRITEIHFSHFYGSFTKRGHFWKPKKRYTKPYPKISACTQKTLENFCARRKRKPEAQWICRTVSQNSKVKQTSYAHKKKKDITQIYTKRYSLYIAAIFDSESFYANDMQKKPRSENRVLVTQLHFASTIIRYRNFGAAINHWAFNLQKSIYSFCCHWTCASAFSLNSRQERDSCKNPRSLIEAEQCPRAPGECYLMANGVRLRTLASALLTFVGEK